MNLPWRELDTPADVAERLVAVYEVLGDGHYDEAVSQRQHAAQTAALARSAGASEALVVAALLHDLGHLLGGEPESGPRERDMRHEVVASRFLGRWFGPEVTQPIRHHVAAKRYLCATEPGYHATLSPASVRSLELQGGVMSDAEVDEFERLPGAADAAMLRRWDDLAKDPDLVVDDVRSYLGVLSAMAVAGWSAPGDC
jgi:[1-hydroxy-2-(trimethylamino)ethyl]phosphonate dioxygenase